jgi:outer membrane protein OmpA-like peptidoglycan-associated protein
VPAALLATACVSHSAYSEQAEQLRQVQEQSSVQQAHIVKMQAENKWVAAGDLFFPDGGYQLNLYGQAALSQYVPQLKSAQNTKIVVLAYFHAQGVNPNVLSAKGFGETHPVAPNDSPQGRAQNRRIEIVREGPGA